jgi:CheY-like chemotaxis protein
MSHQISYYSKFKAETSFLNTILNFINTTKNGFRGQQVLIGLRDRSNIGNDPKHCILVVDDNIETISFFKITLEQEGFYVDIFSDPLEVIQSFKPDYYDLLLLDIKLPHINGFELYRLLKGIDKSIKVCFITGFEPYYKSLTEQFDLDVNCFIRKPIKKNELIKHIIDQLITSD